MVGSDFSYKPWRTRMATNLQVSAGQGWSLQPGLHQALAHALGIVCSSGCVLMYCQRCVHAAAGWALYAEKL